MALLLKKLNENLCKSAIMLPLFLEMNLDEYLEKMKKIQEKLLVYLESNEKNETLHNILEDTRFHEDRYELISLLHFVLRISNNHHRDDIFDSKIEEILRFFKEDIKTKIPNSELFHIFKSNKKILLFLHQEGLFKFDNQITKIITQKKYVQAHYPQYFSPEIREFLDDKWYPKVLKEEDCFPKKLEEEDWFTKGLPENFNEKRIKGENDDYICELIQKDLIDDFVKYVNQVSYPLDSIINQSIYETNNFLLKEEEISLIEYAVFFGSIQIFNFLKLNEVKLTPSLWLYAIHGKNGDIIHSLEENGINPNNNSYKECLNESIKCHHNDIANYILDHYLSNEKENLNDIMVNSLKYYNLYFEQKDLINESSFFYLCKYDYYIPVTILLNEKDIDINTTIIYAIKI